MPTLTAKELQALETQLELEQLLACKCRDAASATADPSLRSQFRSYAQQHKIHYRILLQFLE